ncbi:MAG: alpha/beta fold hydrolase [Actinomycetota bacterium]
MTKVFVHGNPETAAIWGPLIAALSERGVDDAVAVSPPGFGAPVPEGFEATPAGYVDWLANELEAIDGPIDLVGHDWGTGHVLGLAASRPDLIRSWAVDILGIAHGDYVWHDAAQIWRTPGAGEEMVEGMAALPTADKAAMFVGFGMPEQIATEVAEWLNADMAASILSLYRGADPEVLADLAARLEAADRRPALAISALDDPYVAADLATEPAERFGATVVELPGKGHWWMFGDLAPAADALTAFWASL